MKNENLEMKEINKKKKEIVFKTSVEFYDQLPEKISEQLHEEAQEYLQITRDDHFNEDWSIGRIVTVYYTKKENFQKNNFEKLQDAIKKLSEKYSSVLIDEHFHFYTDNISINHGVEDDECNVYFHRENVPVLLFFDDTKEDDMAFVIDSNKILVNSYGEITTLEFYNVNCPYCNVEYRTDDVFACEHLIAIDRDASHKIRGDFDKYDFSVYDIEKMDTESEVIELKWITDNYNGSERLVFVEDIRKLKEQLIVKDINESLLRDSQYSICIEKGKLTITIALTNIPFKLDASSIAEINNMAVEFVYDKFKSKYPIGEIMDGTGINIKNSCFYLVIIMNQKEYTDANSKLFSKLQRISLKTDEDYHSMKRKDENFDRFLQRMISFYQKKK